MTDNTLADLGLDLSSETPVEAEAPVEQTVSTEVTTEAATVEATAEAVEKAKRTEVNIGEIVIADEFEDLPPSQRGTGLGKRESKYKFDELPAPIQGEDGKWKYKPFIVYLPADEDAERFRRAITSATTQANKEVGKEFVTRSFNDASGKFAGMRVYRVDGTLV